MRRATLCAILLLGCRTSPVEGSQRDAATAGERDAASASAAKGDVGDECPDSPRAVDAAPGTAAKHRSLETWLGKLAATERDRVLATDAEVVDFNRRGLEIDGAWRDPLGPDVAEPARVLAQLEERTLWLNDKVETQVYVEGSPGSWERAKRRATESVPVDRVHMFRTESPLWCAPLNSGLFKLPRDEAFDRNRCASARAGEWARAVRETVDPNGNRWTLVHVGHGVGWIDLPTALTPAIDPALAKKARAGAHVMIMRDGTKTASGRSLRLGVRLLTRADPVDGGVDVWTPTARGLEPDRITLGSDARLGPEPLTRRSVWSLALSQLDQPYGWGGRDGHRDCSRLLRDVFVPFGFEFARHSGVQAKQGTERIAVEHFSETEKRAAIRAAAERGLVLLYMPGHIMLFLGEDDTVKQPDGTPAMYAVSAISEYLEPCANGADVVNRIDRVAVTTLLLGQGTERMSFIERITEIVVIGSTAAG